MSKLIPELSALMPAYNEQEVLGSSISEAVAALDGLCDEWELVVVDDGSTDATPEILKDWCERDPRVRAVTQPENSGYSRALIDGFSACRFEAVFYTDADAQFDLEHIADLYPELADADMVAGFRIGRQDRPIRHLTSAVYNWLQARMLGLRVKDVNCAFKLFRRSFFDRVQLCSEGFLIDAELYARAQSAGLTWRQVGVPHRRRLSGSTTVSVSTVFETLRELRALKKSLGVAAATPRETDQEGPLSSQ